MITNCLTTWFENHVKTIKSLAIGATTSSVWTFHRINGKFVVNHKVSRIFPLSFNILSLGLAKSRQRPSIPFGLLL